MLLGSLWGDMKSAVAMNLLREEAPTLSKFNIRELALKLGEFL